MDIEAPAILGGTPVLTTPLPPTHNVGEEEVRATTRVLMGGPLSGFIGTVGARFLGGAEVQRFEEAFREYFGVKHAVAFNSGTTALHAAIAALGIGPGDEVIVPPYSMAASAVCVVNNGAIPVFADIDPKTFTLDPESVKSKITKYTKGIVVVNLFGQAADLDAIMTIAKDHNLKVLEDNAQSPRAMYKGKYAGTIGDVGMFSFNVNKVAQCGEGGVVVTNDDTYALRAQLMRNHGESVVDDLPDYDAGPIFGSNYRMTELEAAIAYEQLQKLEHFNARKVELAEYLTSQLKDIPGITTPFIPEGNTHVYFQYALKVDVEKTGISRDKLVEAMAAEGFPMARGYVKPIYLLRMFQERKAFNDTHFPFEYDGYQGNPDYSKGSCPVVERMYETELTSSMLCQFPRTNEHIDLFVFALKRVLANAEAVMKGA
ncbi:MAG: DegT/DnrJ/EryC1/StrS family aminotransferase [Patescibacteria group bacterium]